MFEVKRSELGCRLDLAALCDQRGIRVAVEIGTDRGTFAVEFLDNWKEGLLLYCIDPYLPYPDMPWNREGDLLLASIRLARFGNRVRIVRAKSLEVAQAIKDLELRFVYIDGSHEKEDVSEDIRLWWDRLQVGGVLSGHDFDLEHHGVMEAVQEFAQKLDLTVWLTNDYNFPPSWFIFKES